MSKIIFKISPDGKVVQTSMEGYGSACKSVSEKFAQLGKTISEETTPEYDEPLEESNKVTA